MPHTTTWDAAYEAIAADTDLANTLGDVIRDLKRDIRERAEIDHDWDDITNAGQHKKVTLQEQAGDPASVANLGFVYTKDVGGITELFYENSAGTVKQITTNGVLSLGGGTAAGNIVLNNAVKLQGKDGGGAAEDLIHISAADVVEVGDPGQETNINVATAAGLTLKVAGGAAKKVWHEENDGAASGLDADLLDGKQLADLPFVNQTRYDSGEQAITSGSMLTLAHGLSAAPKLVVARIRCKVNDQGWVVGDEIEVAGGGSYAEGSGQGSNISSDGTNVYIIFGNNATVFRYLHKTAFNTVNLLNGSWKLLIYAYA